VDFKGKRVFAGGGENTIAVFSINQNTGEPTLIQNADTHGFNPRTFAIDAGGRMLVAGNLNSLLVRDGERLIRVPASLAVFRIRSDGKLDYVRNYDVKTVGDFQTGGLMWVGMVTLP
jgi:hypothetical protein